MVKNLLVKKGYVPQSIGTSPQSSCTQRDHSCSSVFILPETICTSASTVVGLWEIHVRNEKQGPIQTVERSVHDLNFALGTKAEA